VLSERIKSVRICFPETGSQREVLFPISDNLGLRALIAFLQECDAVAVEAENLSITEIDFLKKATDKRNRPLFVGSQHCNECGPGLAPCKGIMLKFIKDLEFH
jgi:hypothetical protein